MKKLIHFSWIGPLIFVVGTIIFGLLHPGYSHLSQYLSELGADNAPNYLLNNYLVTVPFGLSYSLFAIGALTSVKHSKISFVVFSTLFIIGILHVVFAVFNCEEGCSLEPFTTKTRIHYFSAYSSVLLTIFCQLLYGLEYFKTRKNIYLISIICGLVSLAILMTMIRTGITSPYRGVFQRMMALNMVVWVVLNGIHIRKQINQ